MRLKGEIGRVLIIAISLSGYCHSQEPVKEPQQGGMGGIASAGTFTPVYDSAHRPITAGGFVESGSVVFQDITRAAGLASWRHVMGGAQKKYILETSGSGVGLIDYDNDGWLDIYIVNGSTYRALEGKEPAPHAALFHNNHDGTFTDVAAKAGVTNDRWGFGLAVGDYDNDGWPDIFVANFGKNRLYHNNHDGTFTDVAEKAGVTLGNWSSGATWGDYDGDGRLDLFVSGYVHYDLDKQPDPESDSVFCRMRGVPVTCGPRGLPGEPDHLFHNNGDGTFTDVSVKAGVSDKEALYGFTAIFVDVNDDGKPDLLVANDSERNYLYINKGDGTFDDQSIVFITDFSDDYKALYRNDGDASFVEAGRAVGIGQIPVPFVGWGDGLIDYDNDGWKDIFMVNGHVYPQVDEHDWGNSYAQRPLLFHNLRNGRFEYIPPVKGTGLAAVVSGRGAAFGDLFNDGKIDVVINPIDGPPVLLRNVNPDHHHWVELKLIGGPKSPRDAMGAKVFLNANGMRQREDVMSSGSYISANDQRAHFGLGDALDPGTAEIHWPSGAHETVKLPNVDRIYTITEGAGITAVLCPTGPCAQSTSVEPSRGTNGTGQHK